MKLRRGPSQSSGLDEQQATGELKRQMTQLSERPAAVPSNYWPNLMVRTNQRIDESTSAKALSISWAARVAIPGVVAILFFFIGLHYYVPDQGKKESSVVSLVNMLPQEAVDSILAEHGHLGTSVSPAEVSPDIFQFSTEQITEYLVATGKAQAAVENLNDNEVRVLLSAMDTRKNL